MGALNRGSPMSPVDFKKCNVPCRYFRNVPVDFKIALCCLSILRNTNVPCCLLLNVPVDFKGVQCRPSVLRNGRVALSNLRFKGPTHRKLKNQNEGDSLSVL